MHWGRRCTCRRQASMPRRGAAPGCRIDRKRTPCGASTMANCPASTSIKCASKSASKLSPPWTWVRCRRVRPAAIAGAGCAPARQVGNQQHADAADVRHHEHPLDTRPVRSRQHAQHDVGEVGDLRVIGVGNDAPDVARRDRVGDQADAAQGLCGARVVPWLPRSARPGACNRPGRRLQPDSLPWRRCRPNRIDLQGLRRPSACSDRRPWYAQGVTTCCPFGSLAPGTAEPV